MTLNAPREKVFKALTEDYDKWWPHRYKPDSTVYYEAKPGGLIGESFKDGGGAVTGYVAYIDPPSKIIGNGPSSMGRGVSFYAVETLEEVDGKTLYRKSIQMWGVVPDEMVKMFREGARMLMEVALRGYVEEGREYSPEEPK